VSGALRSWTTRARPVLRLARWHIHFVPTCLSNGLGAYPREWHFPPGWLKFPDFYVCNNHAFRLSRFKAWGYSVATREAMVEGLHTTH
jgi:hypothetical protein